ncbi:putative quinol monooxygenase [Chelatococcus reniformis]|uniref:Antibiotic biosynthesis monooxygenase n=1 Tax=Chelatococcus reniformis TaxID=1494448 RepID=A0A916UG09_9HYPH|nr:putative quinol monooxygenase [Chelatococcus reniformis]GGC71824.1 antibiotic biosynthesis monooxygenase [Chelatococcus reniformis]
MVSIVATIKVKPGQEASFEKVAKELQDKVAANEPGCEYYRLHRAPEPATYVFIERYKDQAAIDAHRKTDHFRALGKEMGQFMDGPPQVLVLQEA